MDQTFNVVLSLNIYAWFPVLPYLAAIITGNGDCVVSGAYYWLRRFFLYTLTFEKYDTTLLSKAASSGQGAAVDRVVQYFSKVSVP